MAYNNMQDLEQNQLKAEMEVDQIKRDYERTRYENDQYQYSKESAFSGEDEYNLAKYQLEVDDILDRATHLLRGDHIEVKNGNVMWSPCKSPEDRPFNEYGVQEIMQVISNFVNRNKLLSNYKIEEINERLFTFSIALSDYIFYNYEAFGMDTLKKRTKYEIICEEIMSMIEDAYRRALGGLERAGFNTRVMVHQNLSPGMNGGGQMPGQYGQQRRFSLVKPWTWF